MKLVHLSIIALLLTSVVFADNNKKVELLKWIETADAIHDAKSALSNGNKSLKGIYGYSLYLPGTDLTKHDEYSIKYGITPIEGTSDLIESKRHGELIAIAINYAEKYNKYVLKNSP